MFDELAVPTLTRPAGVVIIVLRVGWESGIHQNRFAILAHSNVPDPAFAFVGGVHHVSLIGIDIEGCFTTSVPLYQATISLVEGAFFITSVENLVRGLVAGMAGGKGDVDSTFLILSEAG